MLGVRGKKTVEGESYAKVILLSEWHSLGGSTNVRRNGERIESDQKGDDRLRNSGTVLREILDVPDYIPRDLLDKADCVVVFPSVLKATPKAAVATGGALCLAARAMVSRARGALQR